MTARKTTAKATMTVETETVAKNDLLREEMEQMAPEMKKKSIFIEWDREPIQAAWTGFAVGMKLFSDDEDKVIYMKILPVGEENAKIATIRAFRKPNDKGQLVATNYAYRDANKLLIEAGAVANKLHDIGETPNLKTFEWIALNNLVITVRTREWEGRYNPQSIRKYVPKKEEVAVNGNFLDAE